MTISSGLSKKHLVTLILKEKERRRRTRRLESFYPDSGPLARDKYPKHMAFFSGGKTNRERLMLAANRIGKTEGVGGYEVTLHLTGLYPEWWPGRRFTGPIRAWAAGDTTQTVRDIIQMKLLGPPSDVGTGLIPATCIADIKNRSGSVPDAVETITVHHRQGGESRLVLKSYDQKRKSFQGTEQDVVWLDEEPPLSIYAECLIRTMTTNGLMICTFTPLSGMSEVVRHFLPHGRLPET
ncbi:MAG: hypothetical protein HQL65_07865 [Magnetococcales bacterium]|nr:hypothetical protein [Magnetococcales bacterium]